MKSEANRNPGHSTNKGYPYNNIPSKEMFKNRPQIWVNEENKPQIDWDPVVYNNAPEPSEWGKIEANNKFVGFLLNRLVDFNESLFIAEEQIQSLLEEKPFLPEHFGFELVHKHEEISDPPVRVYMSKYDTSISLYRKPGNVNDIEWDPSIWILVRKNESGQFKLDELCIPCHRIAYALFYALQIQVEPKKEEVEENDEALRRDMELLNKLVDDGKDLSDYTDNVPAGYKAFRASFKRKNFVLITFFVVAETDKLAQQRAKFILETEAGIKDILFEEIIVREAPAVYQGEN